MIARADIARHIGAHIAARRIERKLTQQEVAKQAGISRQALSEMERGTQLPAWESSACRSPTCELAGCASTCSTTLEGRMDEATTTPTARLQAFLSALPHAGDQEFVVAPGLGGGFKARHIRRGLERGVLAVHSSGLGLCVVQPPTHGICPHCAAQKDRRSFCDHCACTMCSWFRQCDERASPRVSRERMAQLMARIRALRFAGPAQPSAPALDEDI